MSGRLGAERIGDFAQVAKILGEGITWGPSGVAHILSFPTSGRGRLGVALRIEQVNRVTELCSAEAVAPNGEIHRIDILNGNFIDTPEGGIGIGNETDGITINPDSSATIYHHTK